MKSSFRGGLLAGFIAGGALMALVMLLTKPKQEPTSPVLLKTSTDLSEQSLRLMKDNAALLEKIAELEKTAKAAPPPAPSPVKDEPKLQPEKSKADYQALFAKLKEMGLGAFRDPKFAETLEGVKAAGKPAIDYLTNALRTSASATERFLAAALLEGAADPASIDALAFALKGDKDDMVRRMASHALAVMNNPGAESVLRAASADDADWGVRVNSAYGLAKLQKDDGLKILREAYESPGTPAEYRLAILGGLADVAAPSTAPLFRKILADTKDASYVLMSIHALEKMKDVQSVPVLQQILDSTQPDMVKQAAQKAIDAIGK